MHLSPTISGPRVLHLTQPVDGGVARVVTDLVRAQLADGLDVAVACPGGDLASGLRALGADVRPWEATRSPGPSLAREVRDLARVVRAVRPDLVHAHSAKAGLAGRLAVRGRVPTVFQPHAWSFEAVDGITAALARAWERRAARWAGRTVCVSEAERAAGVRAGIDGRWRVVPNGIDTARFRPAAAGPAHPADAGPVPPAVPGVTRPTDNKPVHPTGARPIPPATAGTVHPPDAGSIHSTTPGLVPPTTPGPVPPTTPGPVPPVATGPARAGLGALAGVEVAGPLVVCVGRLCRQKGQDVLLAAWDAVVGEVPGARLVLVGDGPDRDRLRTRAARSVLFTGAVADPLPWYRAADLVVLPSRWEGMALAPLEAMACGRPVVVTDVDGARESLPPDLAARCLVPPGDPAALAAALAGLLLDPPLRESLGHRGRRHVLSAHDVRRTAESVADVYRELLGAPRPAKTRRFRAAGRAKAPGTGHGQPPGGSPGVAADRTTGRPAPPEHRESIHS